MFRQIIVPDSNNYLLSLPIDFIGQEVEIIAFPINDRKKTEDIYSLENAFMFFKKHAIDFSGVPKWKRENL